MLKRQSPSFQTRKDHLHHLHPTLQFHSTRRPNLWCSRQEIQATEGRQEARHLGKNPRSPIAKTPPHSGKADGFNKIWWTKCLVNPPLSIETPRLRNKIHACFWCYSSGYHMWLQLTYQYSSLRNPKALPHVYFITFKNASWQHDTWIINEGSLFVWSLKGATSRTPLQSVFLEGHQRLHYHHSNFSISKHLFSKMAKKKYILRAPAVQRLQSLYIRNGLISIIPQLICSLQHRWFINKAFPSSKRPQRVLMLEEIVPLKVGCDRDGGGFFSTHLKNMLLKVGSSSPNK